MEKFVLPDHLLALPLCLSVYSLWKTPLSRFAELPPIGGLKHSHIAHYDLRISPPLGGMGGR